MPVLNLAFDALTLALIFWASGTVLRVTTLLAGYGLPLLLGRVSFIPGGVAVTEISMSAFYVSLGVARAPVVVSIVVYRLISFWIPTLLGIPLIVRLQATPKTSRKMKTMHCDAHQGWMTERSRNFSNGSKSRSRCNSQCCSRMQNVAIRQSTVFRTVWPRLRSVR